MNVVFSVCMPLLYVGGEPTVKVCCLASYNITKVGFGRVFVYGFSW